MPSTIDIAQIVKLQPFKHAVSFADKLVISNRIDIEMFHHPCRLNAISVLLCKKGKIDCTINLENYRISENTIVVCTNSDIVQLIASPDVEAFAGLISTDLLDKMRITYWQSNAITNSNKKIFANVAPADMQLLESYYGMLSQNMTSGLREADKIVENLVSAFAHTLISVLDKRNDISLGQKNSRSDIIHDHFMTLLNQYHNTERSVSFYADKMFLTPNYLSGEIKKKTGKTALDWINQFVILEAKAQLKYSEHSVQQIAYQLNFPTQSAFGKYFKKYVGVGPKEYREK